MDDKATGLRRRQRRGGGKVGRGQQQRVATGAGVNNNNAPPSPGVGGSGGRSLNWSRRYRFRLGGKEAIGKCGGYTELVFRRLWPRG